MGLTHSLSRSSPRGGRPGPQEPISCRPGLLVQLRVGTPGFLGGNGAHLHPLPVGQGQPPGQPRSVYPGGLDRYPEGPGADGHHAALGRFRPEL